MPSERRTHDEARAALKLQLNEDQRISLAEIERYGWELRFIRHPPFAPAMPVVLDGEKKRFAVLEADGTINDHVELNIRN